MENQKAEDAEYTTKYEAYEKKLADYLSKKDVQDELWDKYNE